MANLKPAVFLDRDGIVNQVVFREGQPGSPRALPEFVWEEGIAAAVQRLKQAGLLVFVITNQPDIARKKLDLAVSEQISSLICQFLPIDEMLVCGHDDSDRCTCRKPLPGMLLTLASRWQVDLPHSFMVGDSWKDIQAGAGAGCQTILLDKPYNQGTKADFTVPTLSAVVDIILKLSKS